MTESIIAVITATASATVTRNGVVVEDDPVETEDSE